jgi:hypothetical protein
MSSCIPNDFLNSQIEALKLRIVAYSAAINALAVGGIESYELDTGQDKQKVTRLDLTKLRDAWNSDMNQLSVLESIVTGCGTFLGVP